ncbi:MAG: toxin-antitoxin (TA) system antitoxin [Armatimonadota bacterium]|nr:toxin-antitoxin (TA) system antitoxin [Armatimonadota bacterium]
MITVTVDIAKTPAQLSDLLALVSTGAEVIIAEGDRTLALLAPFAEQQERIGNLHPGAIVTTDDFDDPLPDEFWLGKD